MTKTEFVKGAKPVGFSISPEPGKPYALTADPKLFATTSMGWRWSGALFVKVGDEWVRCLASVQLTAIGSKKWEADVAGPVKAG